MKFEKISIFYFKNEIYNKINENFNFIFEKYLQILILHTFYQIYFGEFQIINISLLQFSIIRALILELRGSRQTLSLIIDGSSRNAN